jgi:membrane-associated phospholipid phosphatase
MAPMRNPCGTRSLLSVARARLKITGLLCLLATALLALVVAHTRGPFAFEEPALKWLGPASARGTWAHVADLLAAPALSVALALSLILGFFRRAFLRVAFYAALAAAALLISDEVAKPLVQRTLHGELTFPSGNVTAVSATALAMWLALYPLLRAPARNITLVVGVTWTLLMSLAVVGAQWHTPLDVVGSILLSVGVVAGGASVFEGAGNRAPFMGAAHARIGGRRDV